MHGCSECCTFEMLKEHVDLIQNGICGQEWSLCGNFDVISCFGPFRAHFSSSIPPPRMPWDVIYLVPVISGR